MDAFAAYVAKMFDDKITDWHDPGSYDLDILESIELELATVQIPDKIFALVGAPIHSELTDPTNNPEKPLFGESE